MSLADLAELEKYCQFSLEDLRHKPKVLEKTFEDEKGILGSIIVNGTAELSMIFADRSMRDKILVMKKIEEFLYRDLVTRGFRDLHIFTKDPKFADILVQHFGFKYTLGRSLVRHAT
jgi:hypothetical protein